MSLPSHELEHLHARGAHAAMEVFTTIAAYSFKKLGTPYQTYNNDFQELRDRNHFCVIS